MPKLFFLLAFAAGLLHAQFGFGVGFGVKGGFPFTDQLKGNSVAGLPAPSLSSSDNYLIGPAGELRIPLGFALEVDGLYRNAQSRATVGPLSTTFNANSWEIPYLAKWRFPIPLLKPFIFGGGAYRTFTDLPPGISASHNAYGGGAGLELRIARLRLSGEVRYFRWGDSTSTAPVRLARNQGQVLFGIMF